MATGTSDGPASALTLADMYRVRRRCRCGDSDARSSSSADAISVDRAKRNRVSIVQLHAAVAVACLSHSVLYVKLSVGSLPAKSFQVGLTPVASDNKRSSADSSVRLASVP